MAALPVPAGPYNVDDLHVVLAGIGLPLAVQASACRSRCSRCIAASTGVVRAAMSRSARLPVCHLSRILTPELRFASSGSFPAPPSSGRGSPLARRRRPQLPRRSAASPQFDVSRTPARMGLAAPRLASLRTSPAWHAAPGAGRLALPGRLGRQPASMCARPGTHPPSVPAGGARARHLVGRRGPRAGACSRSGAGEAAAALGRGLIHVATPPCATACRAHRGVWVRWGTWVLPAASWERPSRVPTVLRGSVEDGWRELRVGGSKG